jgi:hypothetical protein
MLLRSALLLVGPHLHLNFAGTIRLWWLPPTPARAVLFFWIP